MTSAMSSELTAVWYSGGWVPLVSLPSSLILLNSTASPLLSFLSSLLISPAAGGVCMSTLLKLGGLLPGTYGGGASPLSSSPSTLSSVFPALCPPNPKPPKVHGFPRVGPLLNRERNPSTSLAKARCEFERSMACFRFFRRPIYSIQRHAMTARRAMIRK